MIASNSQIPATPYQKPRATDPGVLRLNSNEGSLPPEQLLSTLTAADISLLREYPDDESLRSAIARHVGVAAEQVVVTAGADDALDRCCRAFLGSGKEMILPVPEFEMQRRYGEIAGASIVSVRWKDQFPMEEIARKVSPATGAIFITSPNNPTGQTITATELSTLAKVARNSVVVLDHVYAEYADQDLTTMALECDNLIVIRTFSKAWGLAGCRVGYAVTSASTARILTSAGSPYPVSGLSLALTERRLLSKDPGFQEHINGVLRLRPILNTYLVNQGFETTDSQGNFVFADFAGQVDSVQQRLADQGVLVRRFAKRPEIQTHLRITVPGDQQSFDRLMAALHCALGTPVNIEQERSNKEHIT